ncbi:MAG: hypothetical protein KUG73_02650, partial [Pseudomonadales bacterium]|nr:hypothetical protein [Pseudomonadales bacterium]
LSAVDATRQLAPLVIDILITIFSLGVGAPLLAANISTKAGKLITRAGELLAEIVKGLKKAGQTMKKNATSNSIVAAKIRNEVGRSKKPKRSTSLEGRRGIPPASLDDATNRLKTMRAEIQTNGFSAKYNDDELVAMAASGKVAKEQYQVRFMPKGYLVDTRNTPDIPLSGKMGGDFKGKSSDGIKYWSTSFDQLEDCDTDPKLIAEKVGVPYDPKEEYALVIVDNSKAAGISGTHAISPTFKDLGDFAKQELPDQFDAKTIDKLYTPEYQAKYNELYQEANEQGMNVWKKKGMRDFKAILKQKGEDVELFQKRVSLHDKLGSNEDFLGNGLTKNLIPNGKQQYGVAETFTYEHTPQNLAALKEYGAITIIDSLKPIGAAL